MKIGMSEIESLMFHRIFKGNIKMTRLIPFGIFVYDISLGLRMLMLTMTSKITFI